MDRLTFVWRGILFGLLGLLVLAGCAIHSPWEKQFLEEAEGHMTRNEVLTNMGEPHHRTSNPDGSAIWIYEISRGHMIDHIQPGNNTFHECRQYILTFDEENVLQAQEEKDCAEHAAPGQT